MVHFTGILLHIINNVHYFLTYVTFLVSLSRVKGTKNTSKIDATVNFFSAVVGNFTVKTNRKSNLDS